MHAHMHTHTSHTTHAHALTHTHTHTYTQAHTHAHTHTHTQIHTIVSIFNNGWLRFVGSLKLEVSFAKEPYKRDDILQKRHTI